MKKSERLYKLATQIACNSKPRSKEQRDSVLSAATQKLVLAGIKRTKPKLAILEALVDSQGPRSADEIHNGVKDRGIDRVTVYRALPGFEAAGIVRRCDFGDGVARYEFQFEEAGHHHHHVICKKCRTVETIDTCSLERIDRLVRKLGYTEISHQLEYFGLCKRCAAA